MAEGLDEAGKAALTRMVTVGIGAEADPRDSTGKITDAILADGYETRRVINGMNDGIETIKTQTTPAIKTKKDKAKTGGFMGLLVGSGVLIRQVLEEIIQRTPPTP